MRRLLIAVAFLAGCGSIAMAQVYPSRPVTMVVPFPAGGSTDTIGRVMADGMRGPLGQSVIIENVGGASGNLGVGRVARAAPDGYTLILGSWPTHVLNAAIFTLPYDPLNDFEPVALVAAQPLFIIARKAMPAKDLTELARLAEGEPGQGHAGDRRDRRRVASRRRVLPESHRHALSVRALSRLGAGDAGSAGRADRHDDRSGGQRHAAGSCRQRQGLRGHGQEPAGSRARCPDRRRGGAAGILRPLVARRLGAEDDAQNPSSPSSMPQSWRHWPIRRCASGWRTSARRFSRASS